MEQQAVGVHDAEYPGRNSQRVNIPQGHHLLSGIVEQRLKTHDPFVIRDMTYKVIVSLLQLSIITQPYRHPLQNIRCIFLVFIEERLHRHEHLPCKLIHRHASAVLFQGHNPVRKLDIKLGLIDSETQVLRFNGLYQRLPVRGLPFGEIDTYNHRACKVALVTHCLRLLVEQVLEVGGVKRIEELVNGQGMVNNVTDICRRFLNHPFHGNEYQLLDFFVIVHRSVIQNMYRVAGDVSGYAIDPFYASHLVGEGGGAAEALDVLQTGHLESPCVCQLFFGAPLLADGGQLKQ